MLSDESLEDVLEGAHPITYSLILLMPTHFCEDAAEPELLFCVIVFWFFKG